MNLRHLLVLLAVLSFAHVGRSAEPDTSRGDAMLWEYFRQETQQLADACLADIETLDDWTSRRDEYRRQLLEMLGLDPLPEETPLGAVVTGTIDHAEFTVENLHFQSRPGLYVTGNLYIPEGERPFPTVLYVCGHGPSVKDGVSYGNKVTYHHHGVWFARNGYVCLVIDTLQLGEIEGLHHGTYGRQVDGQWQHQWWWNSRGYTPAGVEAWNCVRALDYLQSRPEVDAERLGVTGRSGGGAYSWWIAAIDERIKCAVPVAGITDLQNHVIAGSPGRLADGCVEGHCDCMYMVNTYRWDYPLVAALVAPRPLLIANSDKDSIFPLDGVVRVHEKVRRIYQLYDQEENLGLHITEGPHQDTQPLRMGAFHWFNRHLKGEEPLIETVATKIFEPEQLKVFPVGELPSDEINTTIQETFVPMAEPKVPENEEEWNEMREAWITALKEKVFRGWPSEPEPLNVKKVMSKVLNGIELSVYEFTSQGPFRLKLYLMRRTSGAVPSRILFEVVSPTGFNRSARWALEAFDDAVISIPEDERSDSDFGSGLDSLVKDGCITCLFAPRGIGESAWSGDSRKQVQIQRRFMLLGQTLSGMRVWDIIRAGAALRELDAAKESPLTIVGDSVSLFGKETPGDLDPPVLTLYAALFIPKVEQLTIGELVGSHRDRVDLMNVQRLLDLPQALATSANSQPIIAIARQATNWQYARDVVSKLGWNEDRLQIIEQPAAQ